MLQFSTLIPIGIKLHLNENNIQIETHMIAYQIKQYF